MINPSVPLPPCTALNIPCGGVKGGGAGAGWEVGGGRCIVATEYQTPEEYPTSPHSNRKVGGPSEGDTGPAGEWPPGEGAALLA